MSKYVDRGIQKWASFSALTEQVDFIDSMYLDSMKCDIPILSEDELKELNNIIIDIAYNKDDVLITHYKNGVIVLYEGKISRLDNNYKRVYISKFDYIDVSKIIGISKL